MTKWIVLALFIVLLLGIPTADCIAEIAVPTTATQMRPQITMVIPAYSFRDEEFEIPFKIFSSVATVTVASTRLGEITGMLGAKAHADILVKNIDMDNLDALVMIGGIGARQYWKDRAMHKLLRQAAKEGKVVAAICISPVTLGYAGILKGKRATVFYSERERLIAEGAEYRRIDLEVDGLIVTADGPQAATKFAEVVKQLVIEELEKRQKKAMAERAASADHHAEADTGPGDIELKKPK
ncbi:DJ-1/PfpI family protein [bacterium]|nr:DJ-1/PfpI family protein [bacterium]